LPTELGGNLKVDHGAWLRHCFKSMTNRVGDLCDITSGPTTTPLFPSVAATASSYSSSDDRPEDDEDISEAGPSEEEEVDEDDDEDEEEIIEEPEVHVALKVEAIAHRIVSVDFGSQSLIFRRRRSVQSVSFSVLVLRVCLQESVVSAVPLSPSQEIVSSYSSDLPADSKTSPSVLVAEAAVHNSATLTTDADVSNTMVIERSVSPPLPPSSASSGFSDDDSLHFDDGRGLTLDEFARHVKSKSKQGLYTEYAEIKNKGTDGTFNHARYDLSLPVDIFVTITFESW
jgi:hypothetical protein